MPNTYEWLLFAHILLVIIWLGGAIQLQILGLLARRATEPGRVERLAGDASWVGMRVFTPASLLVLITGLLLVREVGGIELGDTWVWLALVLWGLSFLIGAGLLGPRAGAIGKRLGGDADPAETRRMIDQLFVILRIDLAILVAIVFLMTTKPD
jgi:uncharacterized membrane protein